MSAYFKNFTPLLYSLSASDREGIKDKVIVNILKKVNIKQSIKDTRELFIDYNVKDGERPEVIAHKMYGSVNYYWIILLMNNIMNPYYDWVISEEEVEKLVVKKYGANSANLTHHYEDVHGKVTYNPAYNTQELIEAYPVSNQEYEIRANESKRKIKILDPKYIDIAEEEISQLLRL